MSRFANVPIMTDCVLGLKPESRRCRGNVWPGVALPLTWQRRVAVRPSTTTMRGSSTDVPGCPSTLTSTLASVEPPLLRAVHTYVPLSSARAASIFTGGQIGTSKPPSFKAAADFVRCAITYLHNGIGLHGNRAGQHGLTVAVQSVPGHRGTRIPSCLTFQVDGFTHLDPYRPGRGDDGHRRV